MKVNYAKNIADMFQYLRESDGSQVDPQTGGDILATTEIHGQEYYVSDPDGRLNLHGEFERFDLDFAFDFVNIQNDYLKNFILGYLDSADTKGKDGFIEVDSLTEIEKSFLEGGQVKDDFMAVIDHKIEDLKQRLTEIEALISEREAEINKNRDDASLIGELQLPARMESLPFDIIVEQKNSTEQLTVLENFRVRLESI